MALIDELVAEIARAEGQRGARALLLKDALDERLRDAARALDASRTAVCAPPPPPPYCCTYPCSYCTLDASRTAVCALPQRAERSGDPAPGWAIVPWGATLQKCGATL